MKNIGIITDDYADNEIDIAIITASEKFGKSDMAYLIAEEAKKLQEEPILSGRENRRERRKAQRKNK